MSQLLLNQQETMKEELMGKALTFRTRLTELDSYFNGYQLKDEVLERVLESLDEMDPFTAKKIRRNKKNTYQMVDVVQLAQYYEMSRRHMDEVWDGKFYRSAFRDNNNGNLLIIESEEFPMKNIRDIRKLVVIYANDGAKNTIFTRIDEAGYIDAIIHQKSSSKKEYLNLNLFGCCEYDFKERVKIRVSSNLVEVRDYSPYKITFHDGQNWSRHSLEKDYFRKHGDDSEALIAEIDIRPVEQEDIDFEKIDSNEKQLSDILVNLRKTKKGQHFIRKTLISKFW